MVSKPPTQKLTCHKKKIATTNASTTESAEEADWRLNAAYDRIKAALERSTNP